MRLLLLATLVATAMRGQSVTVFPPEATLFGPGARQHFAVTATGADGVSRDVTDQARFRVADPGIAQMKPGATLEALRPGRTEVEIVFGEQALKTPVDVQTATEKFEVSFVKDIVPLFTRGGCAGANCHGSIRGKGGFKLSLFGYEPDLDYESILKADQGRRVNLAEPAQSLILRKPSFQIPHGGGERFKVDSLEYRAIRDWIARGAHYDSAGSPRITSLTVAPHEQRLVGIGSKQRLIVMARYTDGSIEDVTTKVQFTSNQDAIASVSAGGMVTAEAAGETAIMVRTLGQAAVARILVTKEPPLANYPELRTSNFIDRLVFAKLREANILPSAPASDEAFLRRAYLDVLGVVPSVDEALAFLQSKDADKRAKLVETLLQRPERAEFWAQYFADLFRLGFNESRDKGAKLFYNWLRDAIDEDRPYNRVISELLTGQGNLFYDPTANFYFITRKLDPGDVATHVSQTVLGVRIECAKCHNHPWEKWTQDDFYGLAAFFPRLATKFVNAGSESNVYLRDSGEVIHPRSKKHVQPRYLAGDLERELPGEDIREKLAAWITSPRNPFFARAIVNRIWKRYLGRGIVEPVDDFRVTNPPSNEKLLDALADDFVRNGYSIRHTERLILNSQVYQLSSRPNESNRTDNLNYSRYYLKRMMAEQLLDSVVMVTGAAEQFAGWVPVRRAMALPHGSPGDLLTIFGRVADREFIRDRDSEPNITQTLHLINGGTIQNKLADPGGNLTRWLTEYQGRDPELFERIYLAALARRPSGAERRTILAEIAGATGQRKAVFQDLVWALLNSKEFLYVH